MLFAFSLGSTIVESIRPSSRIRRWDNLMNTQSLRKLFNQLTLSVPLTSFYDRIWPIRTLGKRGEREAERFLLRLGMIIVARGYEDRAGEIDLIAIDGETVVFVEVKTRTSDHAGGGFEAVDETKQKKENCSYGDGLFETIQAVGAFCPIRRDFNRVAF